MSRIANPNAQIAELEKELRSREAELNDVSNMGVLLTSMFEIDAILSAMMEMSLHAVSAEVGCILIAEGGRLSTGVSWGVDGSLTRAIDYEDGLDIAEWSYRMNKPAIINRPTRIRGMEATIGSVISVPIRHKSRPLGVLVAINKASGGGFSSADEASLRRLTNFAAVAIENARLLKELLQKQQLEQELSLAKEVQKALLPNSEIDLKGARVESLYLPAGQVGGDYFDLIRVSDTEFTVIVGDVSSKGVPAALTMTAARSAIRAEIGRGRDVADIVTHINRVLCQDVMKHPEVFITLLFAHFDLESRKCTYTNAGHLPPFVYSRRNGVMRRLEVGGTIIGQFEDFEYDAETIDLSEGDRMLLFTDGATECINDDNEMFGRERLGNLLIRLDECSPGVFMRRMAAEIESFTGGAGHSQFDDMTAVLVDIQEDIGV